ncbi:MAG: phytoene desaturase family protein [Angustibacter sp.]
MARVVVVGAGVGGLAAAIRLSAQGHQVTVLERTEQVGGKLGWYSRDGFSFDTGPSLLTLPAVYRDLFRTTGDPLERYVDLIPTEPAFHYRFDDGTELDLPNAAPGRVSAAFDDALGDGTGAQWAALMRRAGRVWDITRDPFLQAPLNGVRTLARQATRVRELTAVAPWRSLRGLGSRYLRDPRLRTVLDRYATYTGSDPRRAPAALVTVPYVEQAFGAWYVRGGLHQLAVALNQRLQERGVEIRYGTPVRQILVEAGRVAGVLCGEARDANPEAGRVDADVVIANVDATAVYRDLLNGPVAERALRTLRRATPSLSGFVLLVALRGRTPSLRHHTVLFPADYDDEFDSVFGVGRHDGRPRAVPDPTIYLSAPDDPALRPDEDHEAWYVLVNAPRHAPGDLAAGIDWDEPGFAERYADGILATLARRGLDVRDRVRWRQIRTPADLERATGSVGGSIYGTSSNGARAAFLRPANRSPVPGLFLVGGSAHPGGGLPLVAMSAQIVAQQIGPA